LEKRIVRIAAAAAIIVLFISVAEYYYLYTMFGSVPASGKPSTPSSLQTPPIVSTDLNWGGYAVASDFNNPQPVVTAVSGSWVVPTVTVSQNDAFSAIWVGIGGTYGKTLIQTGTEQDCINGVIYYSAWFELLPSDSVTIPTISVSPGDVINASITLVDQKANSWLVLLSDLTNGQSFSQTFVYASSQLSAEWTVERPTVNNVLSPLANIGTVTFTNCRTIIETCPGTVGEFANIQNVMSNKQRTPLVDVSNLSSDGSGFSVKFLQSQ
jgi:hypothetical protein